MQSNTAPSSVEGPVGFRAGSCFFHTARRPSAGPFPRAPRPGRADRVETLGPGRVGGRVLIPLYDRTDDIHARLFARGAELEAAIGKLVIEPGRRFAATRRDFRAFIAESEDGRDLEALVEELLSWADSGR